MKLSILIPIYNVEKYISRCVYSLIEQVDMNYTDTEIIFINDASPDNSMKVLKDILSLNQEFSKRVKIISHDNNKGLAAARNTAIENCNGDYIMFLDSDDSLDKYSLKKIHQILNENDSDIIVFGMNQINSDGEKLHTQRNIVNIDKEKYINDILMRDCIVSVCAKVFSKRLFIDNNIRFIEGLNYGEDYVSLPRIVYFAKSVLDKTNIYTYNYYQDNINSYTTEPLNKSKIDNILKAVCILSDFFERNKVNGVNNIATTLKIRNKVYLLEYSDMATRKQILDLFKDLNGIRLQMPLKHRIVWELARRNAEKILNLYIDMGKRLKSSLILSSIFK